MIVVVVEDIDTNHSIDTNEMDIDDRNEVNTNVSDGINLRNYMMKQQTEKAKCNICGVILSRKNGATSGLHKNLYRVNLLEKLQQNHVQNLINFQLKKKTNLVY